MASFHASMFERLSPKTANVAYPLSLRADMSGFCRADDEHSGRDYKRRIDLCGDRDWYLLSQCDSVSTASPNSRERLVHDQTREWCHVYLQENQYAH